MSRSRVQFLERTSDARVAETGKPTCLLGRQCVEVAAHDWMKDPLSRTTWMTHRPGQLTRDLAGLQQPAGVVHFASSDNASLWGGFVDGAIESGLREARRVAAELAPAG